MSQCVICNCWWINCCDQNTGCANRNMWWGWWCCQPDDFPV